jgi:hypothetical protein
VEQPRSQVRLACSRLLDPFCVFTPQASWILTPYPVPPFPLTTVLYALGTVVSLIGTGFLIGVCLNLFRLERALKILGANETVQEAVETSKLASALTSIPCSTSPSLPLDVQARPCCRVNRILGYGHHDLHLSLCDW